MKKLNRRQFLGVAGLGVGAAGATAFATNRDNPNNSTTPANVAPPAVAPARRQEVTDWQEIDRLHKEQVDKFLANIGQDDNFWRPPMEYTESEDGYKVFDITIEEMDWETEPGSVFPAFGYNGMFPGPTIRVTEGDKVRVNVVNNMSESSGIHFHGVRTPNDQDGVPFVTQPAIEPGTSYTYEFDIVNPGTHMYHSHHNAAEQVVRGLIGAFIIDPADPSTEPEYDSDYMMVLGDSGLGYTINGKSFPYTQPIVAKLGERVRIRYLNEGLLIHPMHLHGMAQTVIAHDGNLLDVPYKADTVLIAPGERRDVIVTADNPGLWAFHCHILTHAESRRGLFGMTTVFVVDE